MIHEGRCGRALAAVLRRAAPSVGIDIVSAKIQVPFLHRKQDVTKETEARELPSRGVPLSYMNREKSFIQ